MLVCEIVSISALSVFVQAQMKIAFKFMTIYIHASTFADVETASSIATVQPLQ